MLLTTLHWQSEREISVDGINRSPFSGQRTIAFLASVRLMRTVWTMLSLWRIYLISLRMKMNSFSQSQVVSTLGMSNVSPSGEGMTNLPMQSLTEVKYIEKVTIYIDIYLQFHFI